MRLARVGIESAIGYLQGGVPAWKQGGFPVQTLEQISVQDLSQQIALGKLQVLDVRREGEWQAGHLAGAQWSPLDRFGDALPNLDRNIPIAVHCKSGYRSLIACSFLQRAGYHHIVNVLGGFDAWQQAQLPFVSETAVEA